MRQERCDGLHLIQDMRGALVGDSHDQGVGHVVARFFLAKGKYCRAWRIGNRVRVADVFIAISQSMEGKKVQSAVGNEDQVLGVEMFADWSDEFCAEGFQMAVGS